MACAWAVGRFARILCGRGWQRHCSIRFMLSDTKTDERRDVEMREALLNRFRCEIQHTPGLALTPEQASRLFGVPRDVCGRLLAHLAKQGAIYLRPDGRFVGLPRKETVAES
jgi:hypothetical protein